MVQPSLVHTTPSLHLVAPGKDLVSSLASGLLTIGDRFGGALDGAAKEFTQAYDSNIIPMEFVNSMRKQHKLIPGIGHRVKSVSMVF